MSKLKDRADKASDGFMERLKHTRATTQAVSPVGKQRGVVSAIQREGVDRSLYQVDKEHGVIWEGNGRLPELINPEDVQALAADIEKHGQHQPAVGRFIEIGGERRVEIIAGGTRARACWQLGKPVLVRIIEGIDDKKARAIQCGENAKRADFSAFERGMIYRQMLERGDYANASELAKATGTHKGTVAKALKVGALPIEFVHAIGKNALGYREGDDLARMMSNHPKRLAAAVEHAKALPRCSGKAAYVSIRAVLAGHTRQRAPRRSWRDYLFDQGTKQSVVMRVRDARTTKDLEIVIPSKVIGTERERVLNEISQLLGRRLNDAEDT